MRLTELEPRWLTSDVFSFKCPHCREVTLLCKRIPLSFREQVKLVNSVPEDEDDWPIDFVPMKESFSWIFTPGCPFDVLTVSPSIDASASGHWHGFITNGEIR